MGLEWGAPGHRDLVLLLTSKYRNARETEGERFRRQAIPSLCFQATELKQLRLSLELPKTFPESKLGITTIEKVLVCP